MLKKVMEFLSLASHTKIRQIEDTSKDLEVHSGVTQPGTTRAEEQSPNAQNELIDPTDPYFSSVLREQFSFVDETVCLTLYGQIERQRSAAKELVKAGLECFRFFPGFDRHSTQVKEAFDTEKVVRFPPCFRCGELSCGKSDCNNTLTPPQVANFLSFIEIFRYVIRSPNDMFLIVEDDCEFQPYNLKKLSRVLNDWRRKTIEQDHQKPVLLRLANSRISVVNELLKIDTDPFISSSHSVPSNPAFVINTAFAKLAFGKLEKITHTSDNYVHQQLKEYAEHFTFSPPLVRDKSTRLELPPTVMPRKSKTDATFKHSDDKGLLAPEWYGMRHKKVLDLAVIGSPRCGTQFAAQVLSEIGLDIGHEKLGADGISSWLFSVKDYQLLFGRDKFARNSALVHPKHVAVVFRRPEKAIPSLILENTKNIQSFEFRRRWIKSTFSVDVMDFADREIQSLATYVYWYRICLDRKPDFLIRLDHTEADTRNLMVKLGRQCNEEINKEVFTTPSHSGKLYLGQVFEKPKVDLDTVLKKSPSCLKQSLTQLLEDVGALAAE